MKTLVRGLLSVALCALSATAQTQSITTPPNFVSNNGGNPGGGVYFDITINPAVLVIESVELNCSASAGTAVTADIYTCPMTSAGNEQNMAVWTLVATCNGTSNGPDIPTLVDVPNFAMTAGTYGMAIVNSGGHSYTNGDGTNQTVSTPEITLNLGTANNTAFSSAVFSPRVANLTLNYDVNGTPGGPCLRDRQINSPEATLTVDGGRISALTNGTASAVLIDTTNGAVAWDVGLVPLAATVGALTGSGFITPGGQSVNIDLANPAFFFLNNDFAGGAFPGTLNIPYPGADFSISGQFGALSVTNPDGFDLSQACDLSWSGCMGSDFENGLIPAGWVNPGTAPGGLPTLGWTVNSGGTTSGGTGPTSGANGSTSYIYCETSGGGSTGTFGVDTCPVDFTSLSAFTLDFDLSRIGATIGTLTIKIDDGSGTFPITVATYTGADPAQAQGAVEWSTESIDLTPFAGTAAATPFRFEYVAGGSFTGDIALDNISFN